MRRLAMVCAAAALLLAVAAAGGSAGASTGQFDVITLRHEATRFSIRVPEGFRLEFRGGVYIMRKGGTSISFTRLATGVSPGELGAALFRALGGRVVVRAGDARHIVGQVANGSRGDTFVVERIGNSLAVTASTSRTGRHVALGTLRQIGLSARGGISVRPPKASGQQQAAIPLRPYRAPDGGATALVPAGNDWVFTSLGGNIEGSSPRGALLFGYSVNVPLSVPQGTPANFPSGPYLPATQALAQLFPRIVPSIRNVRIRRVLVDRALPSFSSSGMLLYDYTFNGRPWTGVATVGTDRPEKYSNFLWNFYYSGISVPRGSSPAVGVGLLRSWRSWDPSGAIAARTRAGIALLNETNQIWQETNEFRSRIADQQSRDVGCLLQGYYIVEDNARRYGLPALPCGQIYTERS